MASKSLPRLVWLDSLKGVAIVAVIGDHLFGIVYNSASLRHITSFAVPLFILLAGYTSAISLERHGPALQFIKKRFQNILIPYLLVTIFYQLMWGEYPFSIKLLLVNLATFSANPVLYFVFFYIQLILIAPFLFKLFEKNTYIKRGFYLLLGLAVGLLINNYFDLNKLILPKDASINGAFIRNHGYILGANKLLGGSYLFLFALGIDLGIYKKIERISGKWLISILSIIVTSLFFIVYRNSLWSNPPNLLIILYTALIFFIGVSIFKSELSITTKLLVLIGKASLYIYLLHPVFINFVGYLHLERNIFTTLVYFVICITGPFFIFKLKEQIKSKL